MNETSQSTRYVDGYVTAQGTQLFWSLFDALQEVHTGRSDEDLMIVAYARYRRVKGDEGEEAAAGGGQGAEASGNA